MSAAAHKLENKIEPGAAFNRKAEAKGWSARCDATLSFQSMQLFAMAALWRNKAQSGLPKRSDFGPRELRAEMRQIAIFDAIESGGALRFRVRLLGTALMHIYGEATGEFVDEYFPPAVAEIWHASLTETLRARKPLRYRGRVSLPHRNFFTVESMQAPLSETGAAADRVLLAMYQLDGPPDAA